MFLAEKDEDPLCKTIYFDCNATTPTLKVAAQAAVRAMCQDFGNPSSVHTTGLQAKQILQTARERAAQVLGTQPDRIIFTSGATEGIQTAVFSALTSALHRKESTRKYKLLYGATEHKAVSQALYHWTSVLGLDFEIEKIPVLANGRIDLEFLAREAPHAWFVATMAVNNETGVFQDLQAIEAVLRKANPDVLWLVDSVQALGKIPLNLDSLSADYASFSGHKLYAPKGIGFFYVRKNVPFVPLIVGGGQEGGQRSGTENLPGVAALSEVLEVLQHADHEVFRSHGQLTEFRRDIVTALAESFPNIVFNTPFDVAVPTTINFAIPGFSSREILNVFDAAGVRVSAGSACSAARATQSYVLDAMGVPQWRSIGAVRLSFGPATTHNEIQRGCDAIRKASHHLSKCCLPVGRDASQPMKPGDIDGLVQIREGYKNCWLIASSSAGICAVIDPIPELFDRIVHYVRCNRLKVAAVLDTHTHTAAACASEALKKQLADANLLLADDLVPRTPIALPDGTHTTGLIIGPCLTLPGTLVLTSVATPGHTPNSLTFLAATVPQNTHTMTKQDVAFAFTGDMLFPDGLGRSDLEGDPLALQKSLHRLESIVGADTLLCATHDYTDTFASTWHAEQRFNSLLKLALSQDTTRFVSLKKEADTALTDDTECSRALPLSDEQNAWGLTDTDLLVTPAQLQSIRAAEHHTMVTIDVRESYEHAFGSEQELSCISTPPKNVPLSRFVQFLAETLRDKSARNKDVVFICRSGGRALQTARTFRMIGLSQSWSLEGGLACGCAGQEKVCL